MLHDLFTMEINGKMSGGLNTFASNCSYPEKTRNLENSLTLGLFQVIYYDIKISIVISIQ